MADNAECCQIIDNYNKKEKNKDSYRDKCKMS